MSHNPILILVNSANPVVLSFSAAMGIFSISYLPSLLPLWVLILAFIFAAIFLYRYNLPLLFFFAGIVYGGLYAYWLVNQLWPVEFNNQHFVVAGKVVDLPQTVDSIQRFNFVLENVENNRGESIPLLTDKVKGKKVSLSWRQHSWLKSNEPENASTTEDIVPIIKAGDRWQFEVKLRRPRGFVNPAGFDYQLYLLQQKIIASGYVKRSIHNKHLGNICSNVINLANTSCLRQTLSKTLKDRFNESENIGLLSGLLIGDRQLISSEQWSLLRNTGTIHLLAISGLHIGLAALIGLWFGQFLMRLYQFISEFSGRLFEGALPYGGQYLPALFSLLFAVVYSLLAGLSLPTQRALVMIAIFHLCSMCYRKISPWLLLSSALFVIALLDPLSIRSPGFWLSFLAVATLLLAFNQYLRLPESEGSSFNSIKRSIFSLCKAQVIITFGLFLPSIMLVQGISLSSPLANIIAVPLVSLITVPLLLVGLMFSPFIADFSYWLFSIADHSLHYLLIYLDWIQINVAGFWYFDFGEVNPPTLIFAILGLIYMFLPRGFPAKYLALFCFLPIFFADMTRPRLNVIFLEVGQGTAVVVEIKNHQLVYDTGKQFSPRFSSGQHIIAPYLLQGGNSDIDSLIVSHGDSDHAGGVEGLLSLIKIGKLYSGQPHKTGGEQCIAGQSWQWDGLVFSILWPTSEYLSKTKVGFNSNNLSCVLLIEYGEYHFLLTGDIEKSVEKRLLALYPERLKNITVVLAPHHGSNSSSHSNWVNHLQAKYAIVTAGYTNAYGHPHPHVLERYHRAGTEIEHTGNSGAIGFTINDDGFLSVRRWREYEKRYWYD